MPRSSVCGKLITRLTGAVTNISGWNIIQLYYARKGITKCLASLKWAFRWSFTENNILHTEQQPTHRTISYTNNNILHRTILSYTQNNNLHREQYLTHRATTYTKNNILHRTILSHTQDNILHKEQYPSLNNILHIPGVP